MDYSNPMGGLANPSDFAASPFLQAQQAYLKNDMAIPLIQAQQKMSLLEGLQNAQKVSEFMSPEQRQARQAKTQDEVAGYQHNAAKRPLELAQMGLANDTTRQALEEKAEKLRTLLRDDAAAPAREMYSMLGQRAMQIKALPPAAQAMAWNEMIREVESRTGQAVPSNLRAFNANSLRNGEIAFMAGVETPANVFTARENRANRDNQRAVADIGASATRYAADQSRAAREASAGGAGTNRENTQQQAARLRTVLSNPETSTAERSAALEAYRTLIITQIRESPAYQNLATLTAMNPSLTDDQRDRQLRAFVQGELSQDNFLRDSNTNSTGLPANATPEQILNFWKKKNQ